MQRHSPTRRNLLVAAAAGGALSIAGNVAAAADDEATESEAADTSPALRTLRQHPGAFHAARAYPQFSYVAHFPKGHFEKPADSELLVVVHGRGRSVLEYGRAFIAWAERERCVLLCPLFPIGVRGDGNPDGYVDLIEGDLRYDKALLSMVSDIEEVSGRGFDKFHLFGYSGGGVFANRFLCVHPQRLRSVSIGNPDRITNPDTAQDWPSGTRNLHTLFGAGPRTKALEGVRVQLIAGNRDLEEIGRGPGPLRRDPEEQLRRLRRSLERQGVQVQFDRLRDVESDGVKVVQTAQSFLTTQVQQHRRLQ